MHSALLLLLGLLALAGTAVLLAGSPRGGPRGTSVRVGLALVLAAALSVVALRRHGLTHMLGAWLVAPERPIDAPDPPRPAGLAPRAPLARHLTILLLDGLRVDAAEGSAAWRGLAPRGARLRTLPRFPVKSASSRSLLLTGAPPEVTGVLGNVRSARGDVDHLLRRARRAGFEVLGDDWVDWLGLAPGDGDGSRAATPTATSMEGRRHIVVEDHFACDDAGHAFGAASEDYRRGVQAASERALALAGQLDLSREVLLVLSDHGHLDRGGHAGLEPEVAVAPALLLGAGVREGFAQDAPVPLEDLNATLCVLLGLDPPDLARGVPVLDALRVAPADAPAIRGAFEARRADLARAWTEAVAPSRVRAIRVGGALTLLVVLVLVLRPRLDAGLAAAALGPILAAALRAGVGPPVSADARWAPWPHAAIVFCALLASAAALRAAGATLERAARAVLLTWSLPALVGLALAGLGPAGLAPSRWSFSLAVSAASLTGVAFALVLARVLAGRAPTSSHRP